MTWLRRNLVALIVIALAIPALGLVSVVIPFLDRGTPPTITAIAQGDPGEAGGYEFTLTASQEFVGTGTGPDTNSIPTGSSLIGALIDVTPGPDAIDGSCDAELTSREGGTDRAWRVVSSPRDFDYAVGDDRDTVCILDGEPFVLEAVFLAPTGVYDRATVDVTVGGEVVRLELAR